MMEKTDNITRKHSNSMKYRIKKKKLSNGEHGYVAQYRKWLIWWNCETWAAYGNAGTIHRDPSKARAAINQHKMAHGRD